MGYMVVVLAWIGYGFLTVLYLEWWTRLHFSPRKRTVVAAYWPMSLIVIPVTHQRPRRRR